MKVSFGARMRAQRERRQVSLSAISAATKIKVTLLEALEADDVSQWPSGLFRRSYIRDYARAIGLDPEPVVREFLERYPDPLQVAEAEAEAAAKAGATARSPEARLRRLFGAVLPRPKAEPERAVEPRLVPNAFPSRMMPAEADDSPDGVFELPAIAAVPAAASLARPAAVSLPAIAGLCTRLARVVDGTDVVAVLAEAAGVLDAVGMILWSWDPGDRVLTPALAYGYTTEVLERLPSVRPEAPNAIAAAFRSADSCTVDAAGDANGALVVPLMAPAGAVGVLALELQHGRERMETVRAAAQILAAQLATLFGVAPVAEAVSA